MKRLNSKAHNAPTDQQSCLLVLDIPRTNDKKELAAEQMLAALHGILKSKQELKSGVQEHFSLEIAAIGQRIRFYIWTPLHLRAFVEGQIYAQYPTVQISEQTVDYTKRQMPQTVTYSAELSLTDHETIPIKTFPSFEVDPLAAITATLAKLDQQDEEIWIQMLVRPIADDWHKQGSKMIRRIKSGTGPLSGVGGSALSYTGQIIAALVRPPESAGTKSSEPELSERDKTRIKAIEEKGVKLGYQVKVRIMYTGHNAETARLRMQAIVGAFKQFNTTNLNGFTAKAAQIDSSVIELFQNRTFTDRGFILNIEELASLFHLPHTSVETPNIVWATTKTAEPPSNLPMLQAGHEGEISLFGLTNFRGDNNAFGLLRRDRGRHVYILGQTGTGKSGGLELLTLSDIFHNEGFAIIDPHGDYALNVMRFIPEARVDDVVYFNPADTAYPIAFNPLELTDPALKGHICSELIGVMKRLFESWGPRLEYILRYTLLALLDYPNSTMLDITRMLTEKRFRDDVVGYCQDPVVRAFWISEFASWNEKFASEAVAPVLNKVGAFTANPMIRNIVGQPKSSINIRKLMDDGKIFVVNLSRGLVGEDNAAILGSLLVTKIQLAAMSRADMPEEKRRPFYLYVDEFQNFATDSFAVILSEARKYALHLTVANQYISQMGQPVRDAVFGNVGTIISFRVSPDDAPFLQKYFEPSFEAGDLIQMHNRSFVISMTIAGEKAQAFSARTLNLPKPGDDFTQQIIELSRQRYAQDRLTVEAFIQENSLSNNAQPNQPKKNPAPSSQAQPKQKNQQPNTPPKPAPQHSKADNAPSSKTNAIKGVATTILEAVVTSTNKQVKPATQNHPTPKVADQPPAEQKTGRKRTRSRKRKQSSTNAATATTQQPTKAPNSLDKKSNDAPQSQPQPQQSKEDHTIYLH